MAAAGAAPSTSSHQLDGLTAIRFFAALWVFVFHFDARLPLPLDPLLAQIVGNGAVAMPVFFILSGMVLAHQGRYRGFGPFMLARAARIYPAYVAAVLLCLPFIGGHGYSLATAAFALPVDALLLQAWYPNLFGFWHHGGTWSISVEFFLYSAFPLLLGLRALSTRGLLLACAACFVLAGSWIPSTLLRGSETMPFPAFYATPIYYLPVFAAGVMLAELHRRGWRGHGAAPVLLLAVLGVFGQYNERFAGLNAITLPLVALTLLYAARLRRGVPVERLLLNRATLYLGAISYGFFMYQMPVMMLLERCRGDAAGQPLGLLFAGAIAATLALAAASHRWLEPAGRALVLRAGAAFAARPSLSPRPGDLP